MTAKPLVLYRFFDQADNLLYIGITNSPRTRFNRHSTDKSWFKNVARSTMEHFATRQELEAAEIKAIQSEKPKYNVAYSVAPATNQIRHPVPGSLLASLLVLKPTRPLTRDQPCEAEREARLDELERKAATHIISGKYCPSCELICLTREYDGLIRCLNCLNMWTPEELPSDFEVLKRRLEESA